MRQYEHFNGEVMILTGVENNAISPVANLPPINKGVVCSPGGNTFSNV